VTDKAATNEQVDNEEVTNPEVAAANAATEPADPLSQLERERDDYLDALQR